MTETENLLKRITRIADSGATYKQGRRVLAEGDGDVILSAMIQEIDETILARELTFYGDTDNSITLIAKGRRLWRINEVKPKKLMPKAVDLISVNLSDEDEPTMKALAKMVHNFADAATTLSVSVAGTAPDKDYSAMGLSVRVLKKAWNVAADPVAPVGPMQGFVESLSNEVLASAVIEGDNLVYSSGSDKQIKLLEELIRGQLSDIEAEFRKLKKKDSPKSLIALNRDSKYFIFCARIKPQAALIVCKPDKVPGIVSRWQQLK